MSDMIKVKCPHCKSIVEVDFSKDMASCEDCGTHPGDECPNCDEVIDFIFTGEWTE